MDQTTELKGYRTMFTTLGEIYKKTPQVRSFSLTFTVTLSSSDISHQTVSG